MLQCIKKFRLEDRPGEYYTHVPVGASLLGIHNVKGRPYAYFNCDGDEVAVHAFEYVVSRSSKQFKEVDGVEYLGSVLSGDAVLHYFKRRKEVSRCQ